MMYQPQPLPTPPPELQAHSGKLMQVIRQEIERNHGAISFQRYMELALYAPGLGYYSAGLKKFGAEGDFVTAPEISPLFSHCVAKQCEQVLKTLDQADILEFGAGSAIMAAELLTYLQQKNCLPDHYYIIEISADLRARQQDYLKSRLPQFYDRIVWLDQLPKNFRGVILANEVLDAMPIERFQLENQQINQYYVAWENNSFVWKIKPADEMLAREITELAIQNYPYISEINLLTAPWINSISECLSQGLILLIDYGFPQHEYYFPDRSMGTLMCHYRQYAHTDPLILTGLQDITAHVDFTAVAEAAVQSQLKVAGFTSQAAFLLSLGLLDLANNNEDVRAKFNINQQIQKLTSPAEMGELFKVMALTKDLNLPLHGFALHDQRHRL
jgi:SAM-dependent MidA family methyltransferase